ncbi:MAG: response regulator [Acidobacteria bacterium]|nr:response regulator [Acidobacteriota bacterium]
MQVHALCLGCSEEHIHLIRAAAAGLPWQINAEELNPVELPGRLQRLLHQYALVVLGDEGLAQLLTARPDDQPELSADPGPGRCLFLLSPAAFPRLGQVQIRQPVNWILLDNDGTSRLRRYLEQMADLLSTGEDLFPTTRSWAGGRPKNETIPSQVQRIQVQKQAALKQLAGGVAHDFNNILNGIMGYLSLIKLDLDRNSPYFDYLEDIEKSARRGVALSSLLLRYSRRRQLNKSVIHLNELVRQSTVEALEGVGERIDVEYELNETLPDMEADAQQIREAIIQICRNGAAAMAEGGRLRIRTVWRKIERHDHRNLMALPEGNYLGVEIADSGTGMSEEVRDRMFEPYFTTRKETGGRGLGLTVAYSVMAAHDGGILVDSAPGKGTIITLLFPSPGEDVVTAPVPAAVDKAGREKPQRHVPCILLVDDDEMVRNTASRLFRKLGYAVRVAEDGREALTIFDEQSGTINLVFLDMIMPRLNGEQTFAALRERNPHLPVILISGYSVDHTIRELLRRGAAGFLQKPISLEDIQSILDQILPWSPIEGK